MSPETLRIAFATHEYVTEDSFAGGIANHVGRLARALADHGHDVHVVTRSEIDEAEFEHEGVMVHRVRVNKVWHRLNRLTRYRLSTTIYLLGLSFGCYRKLKRLNAERPFNLFQFPNCPYCGLISSLFLRVPHVLLAASYQPIWNDLRIERKLDFRAAALLEKLQARLSRNIYAPSYCMQQTLATEGGMSGVRVIRTPIYLETNDWDNSVYDRALKGKEYLLFFGRFDIRKGFHILAQALPRFLERYPDAYAVLVGRDMKSQLAPSMANYARSVCGSLAERLILMEEMRHKHLYPVIAGARLVVLPSLMDNLPNACLEAMALGKPVIGTSGASFEEMISDEETGFLVSPDNSDQLAEKIIYAWTHANLPAIGRAAQCRTEEWAPEKTVESLLAYYREILKGN